MRALRLAGKVNRQHVELPRDVAAEAGTFAGVLALRGHLGDAFGVDPEVFGLLTALGAAARARRGRPRDQAAARKGRLAGYESGKLEGDPRYVRRLRRKERLHAHEQAMSAAGHTILTMPSLPN